MLCFKHTFPNTPYKQHSLFTANPTTTEVPYVQPYNTGYTSACTINIDWENTSCISAASLSSLKKIRQT